MKRIVLCLFSFCFACQVLYAEKVSEKARVTARAGLILREGPSKDSPRILTIPFHSLIEVIEIGPADKEMRDHWFRTRYQGKTGWVFGGHLDFDIAERPRLHVEKGTFGRIDMGDYYHLVMFNESGEEVSFWLYKKTEGYDLEKIEPNQGEYAGKPVEITWRECVIFVPEAVSFERIRMVVKIRFPGR